MFFNIVSDLNFNVDILPASEFIALLTNKLKQLYPNAVIIDGSVDDIYTQIDIKIKEHGNVPILVISKNCLTSSTFSLSGHNDRLFAFNLLSNYLLESSDYFHRVYLFQLYSPK
jgi:hypothetical protein